MARLSVQLVKKYPYVAPSIEFKDVKGLSKKQQSALRKQLVQRANNLAGSGSVMMMELVKEVEDYLLAHNENPKLSAWEQMKAREAVEQAGRQRAQKEINRVLETSSNPPQNLPLSPPVSSDPRVVSFKETGYNELERELIRQRNALATADELRKNQLGLSRLSSGNTTEAADDMASLGDEDLDEFEYDPTRLSGSSRYLNDFVELGLLGRG